MVDSSTQRAAGAPSPRQRHDARQRARRLHDGQLAVAAEGVLALQPHDEVQALVLDAREGPRRDRARAASAPARPRARSTARATRAPAGVQSVRLEQRHALRRRSAGSSSSLRQRYWSAHQARGARRGSPSSCSGIDMPSAAELRRRRAPAAASGPRRGSRRTHRGCCEEMHRNFSRSSSGTVSSKACVEHALVELEERQFAVDVVLRAP